MAITLVASTPIAGTGQDTATATAISVTPPTPTGVAAGDRVFIYVVGNGTPTTPTGWNTLGSFVLGLGTPAAAAGTRIATVFWRDWATGLAMPAITQSAVVQPTLTTSATALRKGADETWRPPASGQGNDTASNTTHTATSAQTILTAPGDRLLILTAFPSNTTTSAATLTQTGMVHSGLTNTVISGGNTLGDDAAHTVWTAAVTTGGTGAPAHGLTLGTARSSGSYFVRQRATKTPLVSASFPVSGQQVPGALGATTITTPTGTTKVNDLIVVMTTTGASTREVTGVTSSTGLVLTQALKQQATSDAVVQVWTARATTAESMSFTATLNNASATVPCGIHVYYIENAIGLGAIASHGGASAATTSLTATTADSLIGVVSGDYNGTAVGTAAYANPITEAPVGTYYATAATAGQLTMNCVYYPNAEAVATRSYGLSTPTGDWSSIAFEVIGGVAPKTGSASGTTTFTGSATGKEVPKATATGTSTFTGTATGTEVAQGAASGTSTFTGSATGKEVPKASAVGTSTVTGSATGSKPQRGTATGASTFTGSATGKRTPKAAAAGTATFTGTGTGKRYPKASASGTATFSGSATATRVSRGSAAGTTTFTGTATGSSIRRASAVGTTTFTGSATGTKAPRGSTSGTTTWAGTASGRRVAQGDALGTIFWLSDATGSAPAVTVQEGSAEGSTIWAGQAAGARQSAGAASGSTTTTGSASGARVSRGSSTGATTWTGTATGQKAPRAAATGSTGWTGTASGSRPVVPPKLGSAAGSTSWIGSSTGLTPVLGVKQGTATGTTSWTATSTGKRYPKASATGSVAFTGSATGAKPLRGSAVGSTNWSGSAAGLRPVLAIPTGSTTGQTVWTGIAGGKRYNRGSAQGLTNWLGTSRGSSPELEPSPISIRVEVPRSFVSVELPPISHTGSGEYGEAASIGVLPGNTYRARAERANFSEPL